MHVYNVITEVLIRNRQEVPSQRDRLKGDDFEAAGPANEMGKEPQAKEYEQPLESGTGKETAIQGLHKGHIINTFRVAPSPQRLISDLEPPEL